MYGTPAACLMAGAGVTLDPNHGSQLVLQYFMKSANRPGKGAPDLGTLQYLTIDPAVIHEIC
jgi:hypothetical protein